MKRGRFIIQKLPRGLTHFVDPQWGELDLKNMGEKSLRQLHKRGCPYIRLAPKEKEKEKQ